MVEIVNMSKSFHEKTLFKDYNLKIPDGAFVYTDY